MRWLLLLAPVPSIDVCQGHLTPDASTYQAGCKQPITYHSVPLSSFDMLISSCTVFVHQGCVLFLQNGFWWVGEWVGKSSRMEYNPTFTRPSFYWICVLHIALLVEWIAIVWKWGIEHWKSNATRFPLSLSHENRLGPAATRPQLCLQTIPAECRY